MSENQNFEKKTHGDQSNLLNPVAKAKAELSRLLDKDIEQIKQHYINTIINKNNKE